MEDRRNGANHCSSEDRIKDMEAMLSSTHDATCKLVEVVDQKIDRLIDVIAGKGMIPIDSLKWIIIFILSFVFALEFGVESLKVLVK